MATIYQAVTIVRLHTQLLININLLDSYGFMLGILHIHICVLLIEIHVICIKTSSYRIRVAVPCPRSHSKLGAEAKHMYITTPNQMEKVNPTA